MGYNSSRLTLYAVLSAIEEDLRDAINIYLNDGTSTKTLMSDAWDKAVGRMEDDTKSKVNDPTLEQLLYYTDFPDLYKILNSNSSSLPQALAKYYKKLTPQLERLVAVRNRIAHTRPLAYDDFPKTLDFAEEEAKAQDSYWKELTRTLSRLKKEPSFVLSQQIPVYEQDVSSGRHNLPTPDFDETGFLGRKQQVSDLIRHCLGPYPVITIVGEGGLGKTALTLKAAYDILDMPDCPFDTIVWTTSKTAQITPQEIRKIEGAICDSLGLFQNIAESLAGLTAVIGNPFEEVLNYLAQFKILLILDNLETVLDDRIRSFLERLPRGSKVLITSRIGLGAFEVPIKLRPMDGDESVLLLRALAKIRGAAELTKTSNEGLKTFCSQMQDNPGFIKWFVSAVQAGRRPEDILAKPDIFLDFCMSNVYNYLSRNGKTILKSMLCLPGSFSQAELGFLNEMEYLDLQPTLHELLTTNMVMMTSIPTVSSYVSQYDLSDLARAYLSRHHPVEGDASKRFTKRRQQLIASGEKIRTEQRNNPYSVFSIAMRTPNDAIVGKYLLDALNSVKRKDFESADDLVSKARELAPEYAEVHRVEGWVKASSGNVPAARSAYEAAIELEPRSAPIRFLYGGFLMRYMNDIEEAASQLQFASELDAGAYQVQIEVARANLYLGKHDVALRIIRSLLSRLDIPVFHLRKIYDLHLQYYQRLAEALFTQKDYLGAVQQLENLKETFVSLPPHLVDEEMIIKLKKAYIISEKLTGKVKESNLNVRNHSILMWLHHESNYYVHQPSEAKLGEVLTGVIARLRKELNHGFIHTNDKLEVFFHRGNLAEPWDWKTMELGTEVRFTLERNDKGYVGTYIILSE